MKVLDLFSGIGGFSLGLERAGMETIAFCEIEPFCRKVLNKHWPDVPIYEDVRELTNERLRSDGIFPDIITGGFPCQDISVAGRQKGINGERSGLWSECARLLGDIRPDYAIFENVTALLSGDNGKWFERVLWDISQVGYDAEWHCIPASELGAHHHRDRVWIICYSNENSKPNFTINDETPILQENNVSDSQSNTGNGERQAWATRLRLSIRGCCGESNAWSVEPNVGRVANGIPNRLHRLKTLGNSVVPQISELIGRAIMDAQ